MEWGNCKQSLREIDTNDVCLYGDDFAKFYKGKRVLVTGISGFKGSWMLKILSNFGAKVCGYALKPPTKPALFDLIDGRNLCGFVEGDIRDMVLLKATFDAFKPQIVLHLAAQPIVRESYREPRYTFETNVMGTVNVLECVRLTKSVKSFLNVTTDKVYENREWAWGYREDEPLDGFDPYSNSKSCSELVTHSYKSSFFTQKSSCAISTARAGNVIGGGDFAADRIIPDCVRASEAKRDIIVRNPFSTRPYQHALEPVFAYLLIAKAQYENKMFANYYNVGPETRDCVCTGDIVEMYCNAFGENMKWVNECVEDGMHEANFLKLDCSRLKAEMGWMPAWNIEKAIEKTVEWTKVYLNKGDICAIMDKQIEEYRKDANNV